jgi:hypothetical protein
MLKEVSQCIPAMSILYFDPFKPFHCSPLPFQLPSLTFQQFSIHILISSIFTSAIIYNIVDTLSFSFPFFSFPEFHRVGPLFQTCSTYEFIYDHAYFCYMFIFRVYRPHIIQNMQPLCFKKIETVNKR